MSQEILAPKHDVDALNKSLETPKLDPVLLAIANDYLDGRDLVIYCDLSRLIDRTSYN